MKKIFATANALLVILAVTGCKGQSAPQISIENAWVKEVPAVNEMSAAYLVIHNQGGEDALLSAESDVSAVTELHEMAMEGDTMIMRKRDSMPVTANQNTELKPGGFHIMLIKLNQELKAGNTVNLSLNFAKSGKIQVTAPVKAAEAGAEQP